MRISGGLLVAALLAAGFALYLTGRDATSSIDAVTTVADGLREEGVEGAALDSESASGMIDVMDGLLADPASIADHVDDLRVIADTAASWAAAAPTASRDLHIAVNIRSAAGDLRSYGLSPSQAHLMGARRHLDQAQSSLDGSLDGDSTTRPQLATDGLRDQLQNLEQAQAEELQQVDEALKR